MTERERTTQWVHTWQQAGKALKNIKIQELRAYDYTKNLPIIDDMLQWAYEHRTTRLTSGLIEQQRWFLKMREQQDRRSQAPQEQVTGRKGAGGRHT